MEDRVQGKSVFGRIVVSGVLVWLFLAAICEARIIIVNDDGPADFNNIQAAIDDSNDGDFVAVLPGIYYQSINFGGKAITVLSSNPDDSAVVAATVIDANNPNLDPVTFRSGEDANTTISGFTITGGAAGIYCKSSSPVINKCVVRDNAQSGIHLSSSTSYIRNCILINNMDHGVRCGLSAPTVTNCTIVRNRLYGIYNSSGETRNCIFWDNGGDLYYCSGSTTYSYVEDSNEGVGNISEGPIYFVDVAGDDYHLSSYSMCVDAGDPNSDYSNEPSDGGGRINMGAYGNTGEAAVASADVDGDYMPDDWEDEYGLDPNNPSDANGDNDEDGLINVQEFNIGCDPTNSDSDGDGMPDGWEFSYGLDPVYDDADSDPDDDGLRNLREYETGTKPNDRDSDDDGMWDGWEYSNMLDPTDPSDGEEDLDGDSYSNVVEFVHGSQPMFPDSVPEPLTITVPTEVDSIQSAIDWSIDGDEIKVLAGTYRENINFGGKAVSLTNEFIYYWWYPWGLVESTIIEANDANTPVVTFENGEDRYSALIGFTLRGGSSGVACSGLSTPTIWLCVITDNDSSGIYCLSSSPTVKNSKICLNGGNGIHVYDADSAPVIKNNWIYENENGIVFDDANSSAMIRNNTIADNNSNGICVVSGTVPSISNCILWRNGDSDLEGCSSRYSCIEDGDAGIGNISDDPNFADANNYDYRISPYSPCIDGGDPNGSYVDTNFLRDSNAPWIYELDIDCELRVQRTAADMGADEAHGVHNLTKNEWYYKIWWAAYYASTGDVIEIHPGRYYESAILHSDSKPITVRSIDPNDSNIVAGTIIEGEPSDYVFYLPEEGVLSGLTITGGEGGIYIPNSSGIITKCVIRDNGPLGGIVCNSGTPLISNCVIANNPGYGIRCLLESSAPTVVNCTIVNNGEYGIYDSRGPTTNCILWNNGDELYNSHSAYCCNQDDDSYLGTIVCHPYFVDAANNDFHLLSYSACIDRGNPESDYSNEPDGGGGRINLGAYGNTAEAAIACGDSDGDDLPDDWEIFVGLNPNDQNDWDSDYDGDEVWNEAEYRFGGDPFNQDSDGDLIPDGWEVRHFDAADPADPDDAEQDPDGDWYTNITEYLHHSEPRSSYSKPEATNIAVPNDIVSVAAAVHWSIDGDVIEVSEGTYNESVEYWYHDITVKSSDPNNWDVVAATVIDGNGADVVVRQYRYSLNSILSGFTITGGNYGISSDGRGLISRCIIRDCNSDGISGTDLYLPAIRNNRIYDNGGAGIFVSCYHPPAIANNWIYGNGIGIEMDSWVFGNGTGIEMDSLSREEAISLNTIVYNFGEGIRDWSDVAPKISNCIFWGNGANDLAGCSATYSCIEDGGAGVGNISTDPCFVDGGYWDANGTPGDVNDDFWVWGDYHLLPNSPCIDAGDPNYVGGQNETDIDGEARVMGGRVDMGADEVVGLSIESNMDEPWMYQGLPGQSNSDLTASVSVTDDPMGNTSYSYAWEILLPGDVNLAPVTVAGGGAGDAYWTFAARGCDEPGGLSDSGQTFTVRVTVTGDDYGNMGQAEAEFGIALLGDVNNDGIVNVVDRSIANVFWRMGSAGPYTLRDCDVTGDGIVNVVDRSITNAVWRGMTGQNLVSSPCPLR